MKKFFAKIHLWISIPFGIIISILCLTGALLVFEVEIKELCNPSLYKASMARETPLTIEELMPLVKKQLPDSIAISSVQIPAGSKDNYRMGMTGQGRTSLLVDPYTGEIKGKVTPYEKGNFFSFVRRLHRWFLIQNSREGISWGKMITGTSTLMFVFILISGLIIWIPKTVKGLKRKLSIKRGSGSFRLWYDTHLAGGIYALLFLLVMSLTGLTWSFNWYRTGFYKVFGVEVTQGGGHGPAPAAQQQSQVAQNETTGNREEERRHAENRREGENRETNSQSERRGGSERGNRNSENSSAAYPERGERGNRGDNAGQSESGRSQQERSGENQRRGGRGGEVNYAKWDEVAKTLIAANPTYKTVSIQNGTATVSINRTGNTRASDRYTFNPRSGEITEVQYYKDQDKSAKIRGWIYSVHVGSWGGIVTRILYFIACLIGFILPITGYYIYIRKRWKKSKSRKNREKVVLQN